MAQQVRGLAQQRRHSGRALRSDTERGDFEGRFQDSLKMMELRSSPGEVLDRVARDGEVVPRRAQRPAQKPASFPSPSCCPISRLTASPRSSASSTPRTRTTSSPSTTTRSWRSAASRRRPARTSSSASCCPTATSAAPRIYAAHWRRTPQALARRLAVDLRRDGGVERKTHDASHALSLARVWLSTTPNGARPANGRKGRMQDERRHIRANRVAVRHRACSGTSKSWWQDAAPAARASPFSS